MQDKIVAVKKEGAVAWVTMNRPGSLNSLTAELCAALKQALAECEADDDVRVVVLAGDALAEALHRNGRRCGRRRGLQHRPCL